jgi:hypothetical protein
VAVLYLVDSIIKNIGRDYRQLFARHIRDLFMGVYGRIAEDSPRLERLLGTWTGFFDSLVLDTLWHHVNATKV